MSHSHPAVPALVLAAGLGTRLRPLTYVRAKPAVPIAGVPMIRRIVASLAGAGFADVLCNLHHLPHTIARVLGDGSDLNAAIRYSWEGAEVLGSAGGPRLAFDLIQTDQLLAVNGDTLTDADPHAVLDDHRRHGALVTLALTRNHDPLRYGGVHLDAAGRVTGFAARGPAAQGSFHFVGMQVIDRRALGAVTAGTAANSVGQVYDALIASSGAGAIRGVVQDARFWDIGTIGDYFRTSTAFAAASAEPHRPAVVGRSRVHHSARCTRSILWDDVDVGPGAELDECIVTDSVVVPAGARYRRAVLVASPGGVTATPFDNA